jgi:hypothetical protein
MMPPAADFSDSVFVGFVGLTAVCVCRAPAHAVRPASPGWAVSYRLAVRVLEGLGWKRGLGLRRGRGGRGVEEMLEGAAGGGEVCAAD